MSVLAAASGPGRPLRFLLMIVMLWTGGRILWLWGATGSLPEAIRQTVPIHLAVARPSAHYSNVTIPTDRPVVRAVASLPIPAAARVRPVSLFDIPPVRHGKRVSFALMSLVALGPVQESDADTTTGALPPVIAPLSPPVPPHGHRLYGAAWAVARPGQGYGPAVQLGGSQAGMALTLPLDDRARLSAVGSVAAPLEQSGVEARVGAQWQPLRALPVRLVAGGRVASQGAGYSGPELALVGGVGPVDIAHDISVEAYGQGGAIAHDRIEPYADGAVRLTRKTARLGHGRLGVGAGLWAAAQRDAERLDLGPTIVADLPVGNKQLRLSLDWRQRVGGAARPGSGPALTLGTNF